MNKISIRDKIKADLKCDQKNIIKMLNKDKFRINILFGIPNDYELKIIRKMKKYFQNIFITLEEEIFKIRYYEWKTKRNLRHESNSQEEFMENTGILEEEINKNIKFYKKYRNIIKYINYDLEKRILELNKEEPIELKDFPMSKKIKNIILKEKENIRNSIGNTKNA